jgi:predicted Zn-dependent protease
MVEQSMKMLVLKTLSWVVSGVFACIAMVSPAWPFSLGDERKVGEKLLYSVRSAFTIKDDPDIRQYLHKLGRSVLEVAGIQYFDYHFFVIDDKEFNAFAAPSGLIFFHSGLLATMQSEDELVSVMAHEIAHISKRHLAERVEKGTYTGIASLGLALAALAFGGSTAPVLLTGALAAGQSANLHFSRQNEEEADLLAYGWMKQLDRDPRGQVRMLETMRRVSRYRSEKPPQYLLTHPDPEARLNYIQSLIDLDASSLGEVPLDREDFEFFRWKYRVLADLKDNEQFRGSMASILADARASTFAKNMATYGLAQLARNDGDHKRSMDLLQQVIAAFPDRVQLQVDKGVLLAAMNRLAEAEETLKGALRREGGDLYATFVLGKVLQRQGRMAEAERAFTTVAYQYPEYAQVYFELGHLAAAAQRGGLASLYLGKYDLYSGKLKQAEQSLRIAQRDKSLAEKDRAEVRELLKKIEELRK